MSRPSHSSHSAWTRARIIVWLIGGLITLIVGTLVLGVVVGIALRAAFGVESDSLLPYGVGFAGAAVYVAWLVVRVIRRGK